jgi:uncharacterized protein (DUF58 family)
MAWVFVPVFLAGAGAGAVALAVALLAAGAVTLSAGAIAFSVILLVVFCAEAKALKPKSPTTIKFFMVLNRNVKKRGKRSREAGVNETRKEECFWRLKGKLCVAV